MISNERHLDRANRAVVRAVMWPRTWPNDRTAGFVFEGVLFLRHLLPGALDPDFKYPGRELIAAAMARIPTRKWE
jgi:hypothetical protein